MVVKTGSQFEVLATNTLTDHSFIASPIAVGNEMTAQPDASLPHQRALRVFRRSEGGSYKDDAR